MLVSFALSHFHTRNTIMNYHFLRFTYERLYSFSFDQRRASSKLPIILVKSGAVYIALRRRRRWEMLRGRETLEGVFQYSVTATTALKWIAISHRMPIWVRTQDVPASNRRLNKMEYIPPSIVEWPEGLLPNRATGPVCNVCTSFVHLQSSDPTSEIKTKCVQFPELSSGHMSAKPAAMALALAGGDLHLKPILLTSTTLSALEADPPA